MIILGAALLAVSVSAAGQDVAAAESAVPVVLAQVVIQRSTIIRVPAAPMPPRPSAAIKWKEKDAPKCIRAATLAAAMVSSPTTLDLIIRGGTRYRVKLEKSCSAIDFYQGFYVKPTQDGQICRDRDSIHSRAGGECGIDKFKTLVAEK